MRWPFLALLVLAFGCWPQEEEQPGEPVGMFETVGLMVEQSCGAAIPAVDPIELVFQLRAEENGRAYWQQRAGPMFAGTVKDDEYTFQVSQSWMVVEPDRFRGYVGCSVTQRDVFTFAVDVAEIDPDAGVPEEAKDEADAGVYPTLLTLTGSQTTEIEPLTGSDCRPAVAAFGGSFLALPCRIEYVLTGEGIE